MIRNLENQINWFDQLGIPPSHHGCGPASLSTKMSRELSPLPEEETSRQSSKKQSELLNRKLPVCLSLRRDGPSMEWSTIPPESGVLRGLRMIVRFSEFRKGGPVCLWSPTMGDYLPLKSSLSSILQENSPETEQAKLSAKACRGILSRAERRGKELPEELKQALLRQSGAE